MSAASVEQPFHDEEPVTLGAKVTLDVAEILKAGRPKTSD
jgi:hypothetical protein